MSYRLPVSLFVLAGCCLGAGCGVEDSVSDEDTASIRSALVSTYYTREGTLGHIRTIYAPGKFKGTPRARITTHTVGTSGSDGCHSYEWGLGPTPSVTSSICASLGLVYGPVTGGGTACKTTTTSTTAVSILSLTFDSWTENQLNYEVVDRGATTVLDRSGWMPYGSGSNGCPRNFSPK